MRDMAPSPAALRVHSRARWRLLALLAVGVLQVALGGCTTWRVPEVLDEAGLRARAVSETVRDVRLSAAVLSAAESRQLLGADVTATGIQPVWVEVENARPDTLWLLRAGTDPDYFSPLEVAWSFHAPMGGAGNAAIDDHFDALGFGNPIPPRSTRAGIIFTNPHRRMKVFNVDLLGRHQMLPFTMFLPVPGDLPDEEALRIIERYAGDLRKGLDDPEAFRAALERLPCCAANRENTESGDPLNLVLVGSLADVGAALVRRGFRSDRMDFDDAQRLFGRPPDIVVRKGGQGGVPANWLRMWAAPLRYRGRLVFLVQTGRPVGGRFSKSEKGGLALHPDVDEARDLLIQDLLYSGGLAKLGFVRGAGVARPRNDVARGEYHTDGLRAVLFFFTRPLALSDVQLLDWAPYLQRRERGAAADPKHARH